MQGFNKCNVALIEGIHKSNRLYCSPLVNLKQLQCGLLVKTNIPYLSI